MKIRAIKTRLIRTARVVRAKHSATKATLPVARKINLLFPVFRNKDNALVAKVSTIAEAEALVLKAKAGKKASLRIGDAVVA